MFTKDPILSQADLKVFLTGFKLGLCVSLTHLWVILTQFPGHTDPEVGEDPRDVRRTGVMLTWELLECILALRLNY